jgi:hypothetical protein
MVVKMGNDPITYRLSNDCSTIELPDHKWSDVHELNGSWLWNEPVLTLHQHRVKSGALCRIRPDVISTWKEDAITRLGEQCVNFSPTENRTPSYWVKTSHFEPLNYRAIKNGVVGEDRTLNVLSGSQVLCQLSYYDITRRMIRDLGSLFD